MIVTRLLHQIVPLSWLVVVWMMLWGTWTAGNVVTGLLVGTVVLMLLPLPPVALGIRLRPIGLVRLVVWFLVELIVASFQVAWYAVRPGSMAPNAVVAVQLRSESELILTMTAEILTLVPGSLVIEVDRNEQTLYSHILGARNADDVDRFRQEVLDVEARLIRALGSQEANLSLGEEPK